jgi:hypothetical protein
MLRTRLGDERTAAVSRDTFDCHRRSILPKLATEQGFAEAGKPKPDVIAGAVVALRKGMKGNAADR